MGATSNRIMQRLQRAQQRGQYIDFLERENAALREQLNAALLASGIQIPGAVPRVISIERARQLVEKAERDTWTQVWALADKYLSPLFYHITECSALIGNIGGVATAGRGELARDQIRGLVETLGQQLASIDFHAKEAAGALGLDNADQLFEPGSHQKSWAFYQAALHFSSTGDDKPLMAIISKTHPLLAEHVRMRADLRPGAKYKPVIFNEWLFTHAHELKQATGATWDNVAQLLIGRKDSEQYTDDQRQQLAELTSKTLNAGDYLRKGWSDVSRRRRVGELKSLLLSSREP